MRQHPIPQDITNYKFHLIGSLTLKQFAELVVATIISFGIYSTNLLAIVKWPLILLVVILGIMVAFVPIEERPMDHWIITFFKRIYQPTKFFWKKQGKVPDFFNYKMTSTASDYFAPDVDFSPARRQRVVEYLHSVPADQQLDEQDLAEQERVQAILQGFDEVEVVVETSNSQPSQPTSKPSLKARVRDLKALS